jgi:hypothetical protein
MNSLLVWALLSGSFASGAAAFDCALIAPPEYRNTLERFVQLAASGDASSLMGMISGEAIRSEGVETIRASLKDEVIPFFSQSMRLHNVTSINPAVGASGCVGYWFDTYIVTGTGEVRPFTIVIVREDGRLMGQNVIVNKCRQNRHPFCP